MPVHLPDSLVEAVRDHKCILFLGSGLSAMAGYPNWSQLIDRLVTEAKRRPNARLEGLEAIEARQDYFMLAEFARTTLGSAEYVRLLKQELARPVPPTDAHRLIAATDYRGVITTNYDRLLEIDGHAGPELDAEHLHARQPFGDGGGALQSGAVHLQDAWRHPVSGQRRAHGPRL